MTKLEQLIEELCPNGVEYRKLSEVTTIERGRRVVKEQLSHDSGYPVFQNSLTPMGFHTDSNYPAETSYVIGAGAAGEIGYCKEDFWAADDCFPIVCGDSVINRYVYHFLLWQQPVLLSKVRKASIPRLSRSVIENLMIPVPPLPVQSEIVRILDNFTELTAQLTAELTARQKQYEYYRNAILTEKQDYITTLGAACDFVRGPFGGSLKKEIFQKSGYAVYEQQHAIYGDFTFRYFVDEDKYQSMLRFAVHAGDLIMSCSGTMGKIAIIPEDAPQGIINQALLKLTAKKGVNNKYLKHCFENSIAAQMNAAARGGAIKNVASVSELKDITINLPPLEEQERIVEILDRFDKLCNDISEGLPAEIEARQKQYEYYRDELLTFKEVSS